MERRSVLLAIAVVLAGFSALVHLVVGFDGLLGSVADDALSVLPILFIVGAVLVVALLVSLARGTLAPPMAYLALGVLMVLHLLAYVDVHALGYFESVTGVDMHNAGQDAGHDHGGDGHSHEDTGDGHSHDGGDGHSHEGTDDHSHDDGHDRDEATYEVVIDHLWDDLTALSTKIAETGSAVAFFALYVLDR